MPAGRTSACLALLLLGSACAGTPEPVVGTPSGSAAVSSGVGGTTSLRTAGAQLTVALRLQPGRPGLALLAATNSGHASVILPAWPRLSFATTTGAVAEVVVQQMPLPQAPRPVELPPGQTAYAGVRLLLDDRERIVAIRSVDVRFGDDLAVPATIVATTGEPLADTSRLKTREARIGTLQRTERGVFAGL
ncbi:DUF4232 domain-containing protein [Lentzea sp. NBRC 102530]|uniref:DUF4232 domain-containing protein n=1 Tax=Lentzea sp. NBRC 102530 TaxID=3032201 RepID=UPI0024A05E47|nr:DUF4232 domain-containing protein [Lentzea sp. NBRC 102530]GLY54465.1 hypothetical protein Lesp01_81210 [Lentzea sp. NBRC 102530]